MHIAAAQLEWAKSIRIRKLANAAHQLGCKYNETAALHNYQIYTIPLGPAEFIWFQQTEILNFLYNSLIT